jgi:2-keto-4-pentenoate hydratase
MTRPLHTAEWAARQLADYDARQPGSIFAAGLELTVPEAYALQAAIAELRYRRGERLIGYKVGCTSAKVRSQLGIDHCISGRLFDTEQHRSGASLARARFANLAIEGELAVELKREPVQDDFVTGKIPACVSRILPVIELHHHRLRGAQPSAGELIAHNAIHAGVIAGPGLPPEDLSDMDWSLDIYADDQRLEQCAGPVLVHTISSSLQWLTNHLRAHGEQLQAGQRVLTGSIPSLLGITEACHLRVTAAPVGEVTAKITEDDE